LMNILINAWQAMPQGGEIGIRTRAVTIDAWQDPVWEPEPGPYASFAVADGGVGMDEKTLEHIFEPLFTTKPPGQGTGLGLASVYHIMKNHRGAVQVESQKGRGSTFTVFLPAAKTPPDQIRPPEAVIPVYGQGTIMVVDDEPVLRGVAARLLEKLGYKVIQAQDGENAVEIFREQGRTVNLVLMDMVMPGMNGLQAIEHLRAMNPKVPIILCTGYGDSKGKVLPADVGYLSKPYTLELLSQKVAATISR